MFVTLLMTLEPCHEKTCLWWCVTSLLSLTSCSEDTIQPQHDKTHNWHVPPAKTQISLGIHPVWSESLLSVWRNLGSLATHWVDSEGWSDWADAQADLHWAHGHLVCFVMRRLTSVIKLSRQHTTKELIRLCGYPGWSASLLLAYSINRLSHDMAHYSWYIPTFIGPFVTVFGPFNFVLESWHLLEVV